MKKFLDDLKNSFYNPTFYSSLPTRSLKSGVKFVFFLSAISITIVAIKILLFSIPDLQAMAKSDVVEKMYPDELVVTIKDGVVSTNVPTPYSIPMTQEGEKKDATTSPTNIVTIDTSQDISLSQITSYDSLFVLSKNNLIVVQPEKDTRIFSLKGVKDFTISKESLLHFVSVLKKFLPLLAIVVTILGIVLMTLFSFVSYLVTLLLLAFIPLLTLRIRHQKITYKQAYRITLFTLGPVIVIDTVAMLLGIMSLPFWVTIAIVVIVTLINVRPAKSITI